MIPKSPTRSRSLQRVASLLLRIRRSRNIWRTTRTREIELLCGFQVAIETVSREGDWASSVLMIDSFAAAVRNTSATCRAIGVQEKVCIFASIDFAGDKANGGQREDNAHISKGGENVFCCHNGCQDSITSAVGRFPLR